jgi:hypothetical protein
MLENHTYRVMVQGCLSMHGPSDTAVVGVMDAVCYGQEVHLLLS